eukprot:scaffold91195_cov45-Phaeocystis_antarctica.AAC.1
MPHRWWLRAVLAEARNLARARHPVAARRLGPTASFWRRRRAVLAAAARRPGGGALPQRLRAVLAAAR